MPTIFPWNTNVQSQRTAGKTVDQVDQEHSEANDLETELRRDAMSVAGSSLHPGNSRFVSDGPIPGNILQYFSKRINNLFFQFLLFRVRA